MNWVMPWRASISASVTAVARTDKRGDTVQRLAAAAVSTAHVQELHLHQVLQLRHSAGRDSVKLVKVDQTERSQLVFGGAWVSEAETFGKVLPERSGQQVAAERRFARPLFRAD